MSNEEARKMVDDHIHVTSQTRATAADMLIHNQGGMGQLAMVEQILANQVGIFKLFDYILKKAEEEGVG